MGSKFYHVGKYELVTRLETITLFLAVKNLFERWKMELWFGAFLVIAPGLLYVAFLFGQRFQKRMASTVHEFPNFIVSKQFFGMGSFIAFDLHSRVIVYVESIFSKPVLIKAEDIITSGKYEPQLRHEKPDATNTSDNCQLIVLTKTNGGTEFTIQFRSREEAISCLVIFHEITEKKKVRNIKSENTKFLIKALKHRISENGREGQLLENGECLQYIDYLLINFRKILFRELAHKDNGLIVKAMFESFGAKNSKWLRGKYTEKTLTTYVSQRKTALEI